MTEPTTGPTTGPTTQPLSARVIDAAVMYPTIRIDSHPGKLLMGVFDGSGDYVDDTVLDRRSGEKGAPIPRDLFPTITDADPPEAIYLGPLYFHYGHFLLESLARTWYASRFPELPLVWAGAHNWQQQRLQQWQLDILELLGITNPARIVADPTRFERLHVPDIGFRYDDRFHPEHAAFLGRYEGPPQVNGHRMWLSRSKIGSNVRDLNASTTERRLAHAGWTIAHPETLSIQQQLDLLARAEVVAGEEGSAFHTLILLKDISAKKFQVFRRHGSEHGTMRTIGDARQVDQTFHTLQRERVLQANGRVVSKLNPNSSEILDVLQVPVPPAAFAGATDDPAPGLVIDSLEPRSLLEVSPAAPVAGTGSTATNRVAVWPHFTFDPRSYADTGIDFYELSLEEYVERFHEDGTPFDVIRLDRAGVRDVMSSFRASKRLGDADTTWILGTGEDAARCALAVRLLHPGYTARRILVQRTAVYVVRRDASEPADDAAVAKLPSAEVRRRTRWLPVSRLRPANRTT